MSLEHWFMYLVSCYIAGDLYWTYKTEKRLNKLEAKQ